MSLASTEAKTQPPAGGRFYPPGEPKKRRFRNILLAHALLAFSTARAAEVYYLGGCTTLFDAPPTPCTSNFRYKYQKNGTRAMR